MLTLIFDLYAILTYYVNALPTEFILAKAFAHLNDYNIFHLPPKKCDRNFISGLDLISI